jgi:uncharacterized membrane protein YcjF (UPF0283 family)
MSKTKPKTNKKEDPRNLVGYTYRDMGQEYLMRRKMWRAVVAAILTSIALIVFIALYVNEVQRVQLTYRAQYRDALSHAISDIEGYQNAEGDYEFRYRLILSDVAAAKSFAFLIEDFTEEQKIINGWYSASVRYPKQMQEAERLEDTRKSLEDILDNLDKGYEELDAVVNGIDLKGY